MCFLERNTKIVCYVVSCKHLKQPELTDFFSWWKALTEIKAFAIETQHFCFYLVKLIDRNSVEDHHLSPKLLVHEIIPFEKCIIPRVKSTSGITINICETQVQPFNNTWGTSVISFYIIYLVLFNEARLNDVLLRTGFRVK